MTTPPPDASADAFRITAPADVIALLRELLDEGAMVHLSAPDGSAFSTTVWTVDAAQQRVSLSASDADPQVQGVIDAGEATAVAYLDNIRLQFELTGLLLVRGARDTALQAQLPHELFRFQRRNS